MARPNRIPPQHPLDAQSLMLHRHDANSRFLTDCYLFPAALRSGPCPKLGPAKASRTPECEPAPPARLGDSAVSKGKQRKNRGLNRPKVPGHGGPTVNSVGLPYR